MERSKVYVMLVIVLLLGVCLGVPLGGGSSFIVGVNHWSHDTDNNIVQPTNTSVDVGGNNNTLRWFNLSEFAGDNINWNSVTFQFDSSAGGGGSSDIWNRTGINVYLNNSGDNVGLGDTTPTNKLDVVGSLAVRSVSSDGYTAPSNGIFSEGSIFIGGVGGLGDLDIYESAPNDEATIRLSNADTGSGGTDGYKMSMYVNNEFRHWLYENIPMIFATNNLERLRIEADGLVNFTGDGLVQGNFNVTGNSTFSDTLDMTGNNITNANLSEYAGLNVDWNGSNNQFDVILNSTTFFPFEIGVVNATVDTGTVGSLFVARDGDSYNISELLNFDWTIFINFSGVTDIDFFILRQWYDHGGIDKEHDIHPALWNWDDSSWDEEYGDIYLQDHYKYVVRNVFDAEEHIGTGGDAGVVRMRLLHDSEGDKGRSQHSFRLDYGVLISGFAPVTSQEHDALSGRNNINNHPWAFPIDASRNITGNVTLDENLTITGTYNLTVNATNILTVGNPGDIKLGNDTEYSMYPNTSGMMNLGTALNRFGDAWLSGKLTVAGGVDPPYVLFNNENLLSILRRINIEIPKDEPEKWGGLVQWSDGVSMFALNPSSGVSEQFVWKSDYDNLVGRVERLELLLDELLRSQE